MFLNNTGNNLLYVTKAVGDTTEGSRARKADDTSWHHVALVVDGGSSGKATWYYDYVPDKSYSGATVDVGTGSSLFFGADSDGSSRWFDGWLDDIRVTRRALSPDEFLTTHSVGAAGADASLLAMFENDYDFACLSDESLSLTGSGRARAGGSAPEFVGHSCGIMRLDGQNGVVMTNSAYSAYLDKSVVSFPESPLYAFESYTVEFWAKFKGLVDGSGAVAADSESLANAAPIIRLVPADKGVCADMDDYDWYLYRKNDAAGGIQIAVNGACGDTWDVSPSMPEAWTVPGGLVVDDKWHHWALEFAPNAADSGKTDITLFRDYASLGVRTVNKRLQRRVGGDELLIGEGTYDEPNIQSYFGALRFSAGVLDPSRFLGRIPACLFILYH